MCKRLGVQDIDMAKVLKAIMQKQGQQVNMQKPDDGVEIQCKEYKYSSEAEASQMELLYDFSNDFGNVISDDYQIQHSISEVKHHVCILEEKLKQLHDNNEDDANCESIALLRQKILNLKNVVVSVF